MKNELLRMVSDNETVFYEGRGEKSVFLIESILNPLLPIAIIWLAFDGTFISMAYGTGMGGMGAFLVPFFLFHLMPVWLYIGGIIMMGARYRNTYYVVTDRAVYTSQGVFQKKFVTKMFAEMSHIDVHRGLFDQLFNVGDVIITTNQVVGEKADTIQLNNLGNYIEVYNMIKKLQQDVYSDIMYPNDLRPSENHGYNTRYRG